MLLLSPLRRRINRISRGNRGFPFGFHDYSDHYQVIKAGLLDFPAFVATVLRILIENSHCTRLRGKVIDSLFQQLDSTLYPKLLELIDANDKLKSSILRSIFPNFEAHSN